MMNYNYDVLNNTLTVSEKFLKAAGKYNSAEYNVVKALRADNPAMQIVVEKRQKSVQKNLTFKQMEGFMKVVDADKLPLFEKVKAISRVQPSPYHYVKTWFEKQFPHYNEQVEFDEDGKMTFAAKKEANAAAGDDAAKAEVEEHDEPAALPTAEAGVNEDDVDSVA